MNSRTASARSGSILSSHRSLLAAFALTSIMAAALIARSSEAAPAAGTPWPPEVSVARVVSKPVRQWDEFNGRISAVETVELRPRVSGYIERVGYREGDPVKKGDLLFAIDQRPYRAALARAEAELDHMRSGARLAASQSKRAQALVDVKAISREDFDTRTAATAQSNAAVRAAEASVTSARLDLQFTEVRAPIDGRAGRALVTTGNLAQADTTLLTTVVSVDPIYVDFETDEQTFLRYGKLARDGQRARTHNPVRVGLADDPGHPYRGEVDFLDNRVDPATGTIRLRAVLPNPDGVFTPGLFARVQLQGGDERAAILIDDEAVLTDQDRKYVYVLDAQDRALRKDVVLGGVSEGLRIVSSGLSPQDKIIVGGVQKVFMSGMPVKPKFVAMGVSRSGSKVAVR